MRANPQVSSASFSDHSRWIDNDDSDDHETRRGVEELRLSTSFNALRLGAPGWLLNRMNPSARKMEFVGMNREAYRESVFLDHRLHRPDRRTAVTSFPRPSLRVRPTLPVHFIFHHAFCGSTLLSRCLETPLTHVLREPLVLLQLAEIERLHADRFSCKMRRRWARWVMAALGQGYPEQRTVVIKPSNLVTALAPHLMDERSRALLLFEDLTSFLISCSRKPAECKARLMDLPARIVGCSGITWMDLRVLEEASGDLMRSAALAWWLQLGVMTDLLTGDRSDQFRSLSFPRFLTDPQTRLRSVVNHLGLPTTAMNVDALERHAKEPARKYSVDARQRAQATARGRLQAELDATKRWLASVSSGAAMRCYETMMSSQVGGSDEIRMSA